MPLTGTLKELRGSVGSESLLETMQPVFCQSPGCAGGARGGFAAVLGSIRSIYIFQSLKQNRDQRTKVNPHPFLGVCVPPLNYLFTSI